MAYTKIAQSTSASITRAMGVDAETGKTISKSTSIAGLKGNPDVDKVAAVLVLVAAVLKGNSTTQMTLREVSTLENAD